MERSKTEASLAVAERDSQTKLLTSVLSKPAPDPMANITQLVAVLAPVLVPLLSEMWKNNSPKAHADMLAVEHDQRMAQLTMMAEMMKSFMPDPPPPWAPLIELGVQMIGQHMASRQLIQSGQQRQLPAPPQQLPNGQTQPAQPAVMTAQPPPVQSNGALDQVFAQFASLDPEAAQMTRVVWKNLPQELGFHTHEWLTILFNLHARSDVETISNLTCFHLYHCQKFNTLPKNLTRVFEEGQTANVLRTVLGILPIFAKDPDYANAVVERIAEMIDEHEEEEADEEPEEEDGEVVDAQVEATA
jgi:hypothetical protein